MPLGTIVRILKKHYGEDHKTPVSIGSLTTLYDGLANLDSDNFWTDDCKEVLLNPTSSFKAEGKLKLDISETQPDEYFTCKNLNCRAHNVRLPCSSIYYDTITCFCGVTMKREVCHEQESEDNDGVGGIFTINTMSFVISDDLRILPNMTGFVQTLKNTRHYRHRWRGANQCDFWIR